MDILIKGLEMPKSCGNCKFSQFHEANPWTTWYTCLFSNKDIDDTGNGRLVGCPLIPVPEHGRLVDLDAFLKAYENMADWEEYRVEEIEDYFKTCPVVLERTT